MLFVPLLFATFQGFAFGLECLHCSSPESKPNLQKQPLTIYFKTGEYGDELPPPHKDCMNNPNNPDIKRVPCSTRCLQIYFKGILSGDEKGGFKRVFVRHCADQFIKDAVSCLDAPCCGVMNMANFNNQPLKLSGRGCTCASVSVCNTLTPEQMDTMGMCPLPCSILGNCAAGAGCTNSPDQLGYQCKGMGANGTGLCNLPSSTSTTTGHVTSTSTPGKQTTTVSSPITTTSPGDAKTTTSGSVSVVCSWILQLFVFVLVGAGRV